MKNRVFLPTLIAVITATGTWILTNFLMKRSIDWLSTVVLVAVFALIFSIFWKLFYGVRPR